MMIPVLVLLPLGAAAGLVALRERPQTHGPLAVVALLTTLLVGIWAAMSEPGIVWQWSPVIRVGLAAEGFGRVMVVLVPAIAAPIVAYAAATQAEGRARLLTLMLTFVAAMLLLVLATDFLTLLIAWELVGAVSWALIGHDWRNPDNGRSAAQAFVTTRLGDLGLYLAAGLAFAGSGTFAFGGLANLRGLELDGVAAGVLLAAAAKSAQVPFSPWLFAAMAGPTPVSALLHSATLVAAGAYLLIRLAPALQVAAWFAPAVAGVGLATALGGGMVASLQSHAKRVLAASTSAQYGLMFIAIGASSTAAAAAQLVAHAAFKSLLFLGAGVAIHASGTSDIAAMRLGRALPRVAALSAVGALALAAVPPLGGAWTKEEILGAALSSSAWLGLGVFVAGFLSAVYAGRYQILVYGCPRSADGAPELGEHGAAHQLRRRVEMASMAALAAITLALSILWLPGTGRLVEDATGGDLPGGEPWELALSVAIIGTAGAGIWWAVRHRQLATLGLPARLRSPAADWLGLPAATQAFVVDPVLALSRALARFDDRVIDAGVRAVGLLAVLGSRLTALWAEWTIDGAVHALAAATFRAALGSRAADEAGIDAAVEGGVSGVGLAGRQSRRLQTGLAHHYYLIVAAGLGTVVAIFALWSWGVPK